MNNIKWHEPIVIDFETYYDKRYSLSKDYTTEHYIRSKNFEGIGVSIKVGNAPAVFYEYDHGVHIIRELKNVYKDRPFVSHNNMFDMGILGLRHELHPEIIVDTAILARLTGLDRVAGGASLAKLSAYMREQGIVTSEKGTTVHDMLGVHRKDMSKEQFAAYGEYCVLDSELCYALYMLLIDRVPKEEVISASIITKMFTKPMVEIDIPLLENYKVQLAEEREKLLRSIANRLGYTTDEFLTVIRSSSKFANVLERLGITVPMKWSEKQNKNIPAVSKTDPEFLELQEHENPIVRAVVEAKLGGTSSMEQTRTETFLDIASRGRMPVPLRYGAAHTGRLGGSDKVNLQNLAKRTKEPVLRRSLKAREGYVWVATDSSQIECLAGDGLVLTDKGLVRLVDVEIDHKLWDGVEWVSHDGVVFKGIKDVITYSGITATPDHIVYTADGEKITLDEAASRKVSIAVGERSGQAVRYVGCNGQGDTTGRSDETLGSLSVWEREAGKSIRPTARENHEVQNVYGEEILAHTTQSVRPATNTVQRFDWTLQVKQILKPYLQRCGEQVQKLRTLCELYMGQLSYGRLYWLGDRPYRHERTLRTRQYSPCYEGAERPDQAKQCYGNVQWSGVKYSQVYKRLCSWLWSGLGKEKTERWAYANGNSTVGTETQSYLAGVQGQELPASSVIQRVFQWLQPKPCAESVQERFTERGNPIVGTIEVYDIINAGSRNRFCYNGRVVSNCRINALLSNQTDLIQLFLDKRCPYTDMASAIYNLPYDEIYHEAKVVGSKEGKKMRNLGKEVVLAAGYGMSAATFANRMKLSDNYEAAEQADFLISTYRSKNSHIVAFWQECKTVLDVMYAGNSISFGGANGDLFYADGSSEFFGQKIPSIRLPNGTYLWYQNLRIETVDGKKNYVYDQYKGRAWVTKRIWGSYLVENLCQAIAFAVLKWQANRIVEAGFPLNLNVHDEWAGIYPRSQVAQAVVAHYMCMKQTPDYLPQGLLDCEVDIGVNYADLKTVDVAKYLRG